MAKFVRKLNRDDSGYSYEEVKSNVTPKTESKGKLKLRAILSGIKSGSYTPIVSDAIADAKAVRDTALANARLRMEEAFVPTGNDIIIQKEAVRRIKKLSGVQGRDLGDAKVYFNPETNVYTIGGKEYTAECLSDIQAYHTLEGLGLEKDSCISGSFAMTKDEFLPTASAYIPYPALGIPRKPIKPHGRFIWE